MTDPDDARTSSPCIGLCTLDRSTGLCIGCLRSRAEVTGWRDMGPAARQQVLGCLAARRTRPSDL